jgi:predicted DNA-binding protein with PD1-like motif
MMDTLPLRLHPGDDLRGALEAAVRAAGWEAAFVIAGVGSLVDARLRLAGAAETVQWPGDSEILSLSGSLSPDGAHLHAALSLPDGRVVGGHVVPGNRVRTTAEVLLVPLPGWRFRRVVDAATGWAELLVSPETRNGDNRR